MSRRQGSPKTNPAELQSLFEDLMSVNDGSREWERLEAAVRKGFETLVDGYKVEAKATVLLTEAESKALTALAQGKYSQFGYWAAKVVQLRELLGRSSEPSPFRPLREKAKRMVAQREAEEDLQ